MKYILNLLSNTYFLSTLFLASIVLGFVSLQTFIGIGYFRLSQFNVEILLILNLILLLVLIISISVKVYKNYQKKKIKRIRWRN